MEKSRLMVLRTKLPTYQSKNEYDFMEKSPSLVEGARLEIA